MSIHSWKAEFYPTPATAPSDRREAIMHTLQKWRGLRLASLHKHGVYITMSGYLDSEDACGVLHEVFPLIGSTSALCSLHRSHPPAPRCGDCPLYHQRGDVPCDYKRPNERLSPFHAWMIGRDPEPMIEWLEKALCHHDETPRGD